VCTDFFHRTMQPLRPLLPAGHRIDFFLVSPDLLDRVVSCEIITDVPPKVSDKDSRSFRVSPAARCYQLLQHTAI
jgi:hypothetical protein